MHGGVTRKESTPDELAASRHVRVAAHRLDQHERYLALLRLAQRVALDSTGTSRLAEEIARAESALAGIRSAATGTIMPRRRASHRSPGVPNTCTVYLDECGTHPLTAPDAFKAFVLAAVIISDKAHDRVDAEWKRWKSTTLGSPDRLVHEPDVRGGKGPFLFDGNAYKQSAAIESLSQELATLDFGVVACVISKQDYVARVGQQALDGSLPDHPYLMALDFLAERLAMVLDGQFYGSRARIIAEGRGPKEDALLQYEFARLLLDGTSYVSASWFREQFHPGIEFRTKEDNTTGLQLADLVARPCAEKVLNPERTPDRWPVVREKLCPGRETAHSILGMKIVPWDDKYENIWKS